MVTSQLLKRLKQSLAKIGKFKRAIANTRDALRKEVSELNDILADLDVGVELLGDGCRQLEDGVDEVSKLL